MTPWVRRDAGVLDALADVAGLVVGVVALASIRPREPGRGGKSPSPRHEIESADVDLSGVGDHHGPSRAIEDGPSVRGDATRRLGLAAGRGRG